MSHNFGIILFDEHTADEKRNKELVKIAGKISQRFCPEAVTSVLLKGDHSDFLNAAKELVESGCTSIAAVPMNLYPESSLMIRAAGALWECQNTNKHVRFHLEGCSGLEDPLEDELAERLWPMYFTQGKINEANSDILYNLIYKRVGRHQCLGEDYRTIICAVIEATADFSYADCLRFHPQSIEIAAEAFQKNLPVVCDSSDLKAALENAGINAKQITSDEAACAEGALLCCVQANTVEIFMTITDHLPALILAFPAGFTKALKVKTSLLKTSIPFVTNLSPKGGTDAAKAVVMSLAKCANC